MRAITQATSLCESIKATMSIRRLQTITLEISKTVTDFHTKNSEVDLGLLQHPSWSSL